MPQTSTGLKPPVEEDVLSAVHTPRPNNIFLMEYIVDDLQLWRLPSADVIDSDPACVEFRFLDSVHVSIDDTDIGSAVRSNGKNCLLTMSQRPSAETPVRIEVFKRPRGDQPVRVAVGEIAIDAAFANLFRVGIPEEDDSDEQKPLNLDQVPDAVGDAAEQVFPISEVYKAWHPLLSGPRLSPSAELAAKSGSNMSQKSAQQQQRPTHVGVVCVRLRITCFGSTIVSPFQYKKQPQQRCHVENDKYTICCDQIFVPPSINSRVDGSRDRKSRKANKHINDLQNIMKICKSNLSSAHDVIPCCTAPCAETESCADARIVNPHDSLPVGRKKNLCCGAYPPVPPVSKVDLCTEPPEFDEYRTDVDENALIVRVAKNTRTVCRLGAAGEPVAVVDGDDANADGPPQMPHCECNTIVGLGDAMPTLRKRMPSPRRYTMTCTDDGKDFSLQSPNTRHYKFVNSLGLPVIRGNLKYPAGFETNFKLPQCSHMTPSYRPMLSDPRNCCMKCAEQMPPDYGSPAVCPEGIEVCKKPCANPNFDVFVLKLAPTDARTEDHIELELRTPKSPTAPAARETQCAQTYEEDFCEKYTGGSVKKDRKGKKGK